MLSSALSRLVVLSNFLLTHTATLISAFLLHVLMHHNIKEGINIALDTNLSICLTFLQKHFIQHRIQSFYKKHIFLHIYKNRVIKHIFFLFYVKGNCLKKSNTSCESVYMFYLGAM